MSGGPFRELFVEVAIGLLEAAAIEAQQRRDAQNRFNEVSRAAQLHIKLEFAAKEICSTRGIKMIDVYRDADTRETIVRARLPCRHVGRYILDETVLVRMSGAREIVDYVLDVLEAPPHRRCTCVPFIPKPPCTIGVCK